MPPQTMTLDVLLPRLPSDLLSSLLDATRFILVQEGSKKLPTDILGEEDLRVDAAGVDHSPKLPSPPLFGLCRGRGRSR